MYAGCGVPLYAFSLFLPTIINQVPVDIAHSASGSILTPNYSLDTVPLQPTYSLSPSTSLLVSWFTPLGSMGIARGDVVSSICTCFVLIRKSGRLKLPSILLCIGEHELKRIRKYDLTLCSRRWVHHLDFFQESCVIIRRRLHCCVVSTECVLWNHQLTVHRSQRNLPSHS